MDIITQNNDGTWSFEDYMQQRVGAFPTREDAEDAFNEYMNSL